MVGTGDPRAAWQSNAAVEPVTDPAAAQEERDLKAAVRDSSLQCFHPAKKIEISRSEEAMARVCQGLAHLQVQHLEGATNYSHICRRSVICIVPFAIYYTTCTCTGAEWHLEVWSVLPVLINQFKVIRWCVEVVQMEASLKEAELPASDGAAKQPIQGDPRASWMHQVYIFLNKLKFTVLEGMQVLIHQLAESAAVQKGTTKFPLVVRPASMSLPWGDVTDEWDDGAGFGTGRLPVCGSPSLEWWKIRLLSATMCLLLSPKSLVEALAADVASS